MMNFTNVTAEEAVLRLIEGSAPERLTGFLPIWNQYKPQIELIHDKEGFSLEAGAFRLILYNHITMCQLWLIGFIAQEAFYAYSPALIYSQLSGVDFSSEVLFRDSGYETLAKECQSLIEKVYELSKCNSFDQFEWPGSVPRPIDGKPADASGSMAYDLLCMSAAYCFLHEFKHVMFRTDKNEIDPKKEESECDLFARNILLQNAADFANQTNASLYWVINKRAMGIALALLMIMVITPISKWRTSESHPSVADRISEFVTSLSLEENDPLWIYFSCLLMSMLEKMKIKMNGIRINNQKQLTLEIIRLLQITV